MENLADYPLLFFEDYNTITHDILDAIANHETSLNLSSRSNEEEAQSTDDTPQQAAKRQRMYTQPSPNRSPVNERTGIG